jgi:hypothetical protein
MPPFIIDHHVTPVEVPAPVAGEDPGGCTWSYRVGAAHATGSAMVRMMVARWDHSIGGGSAVGPGTPPNEGGYGKEEHQISNSNPFLHCPIITATRCESIGAQCIQRRSFTSRKLIYWRS